MNALGGAVIVHEVPAQLKAGKIVRAPIVFPWVLEVPNTSEILRVERSPWCNLTFVIVYWPP